MMAVILCAGFATRMYPLTRDFSKPLLPVGGKPVIDYLMDQIVNLPELQTVHIVTNSRFISHFQEWQKTWIIGNRDNYIDIQVHNDGATSNENRLGTSSDLQFVFHRIAKPSQVLVSAGDNIFQFSLTPIWNQFVKSNHHYIVALPENNLQKLKKSGVPEFNADDRVLKLHEKPEYPQPTGFVRPYIFSNPLPGQNWMLSLKAMKTKMPPDISSPIYVSRKTYTPTTRMAPASISVISIPMSRQSN